VSSSAACTMLERGLRKPLRVFVKFISFLLILTAICSASNKPTFSGTVTWTPQTIASGSPCLFKISMETEPSSIEGTWQGHPLSFLPTEDRHVWYALAGVDVEAKPGNYELTLVATLPDGQIERTQRDVVVSRAQYKTEVLRVPQRFVKPDPETLVRIEADRQVKKTAFAEQVPVVEWSGRFEVPVNTQPSEGFGTRRTFNGQLASVHKGMDYHAAPGTPVMAANSGEVVLAAPLFYEGNCVIINHGQQFMTIYMHLSKLSVKEGDKVEKGQEVGLSGATGRATGPHLHVAVRWQDTYLDPAQLWALPLPNLPQAKGTAADSK
jgi:murein DD-endopeptidase MepM/ murein hydrolase activator NlpD